MIKITMSTIAFLLISVSAITIASHFKGEIIISIMSGKIISQQIGYTRMKNKNNLFNNAFLVTSNQERSSMHKLFKQIQGSSPFIATLMSIAPNFNMFLQQDH